MVSKIPDLITRFMAQPVEPVKTRGAEAPAQTQAGALPVTQNAYGQHDRPLEHGFGGAQYRDGVIIGKKLNFEC